VRTSVIACGALGPSIREISARRGWDVEIHLLPSLLHNRPAGIAPRVERLATQLQARGDRVVLAYADCGTYGALDELCARYEMKRLEGLHCYDVFAGASSMQEIFEREPGTYVLTDFLVRSFKSSVLRELGLDVHPELWPDYFANYRKVVWLAQDPTTELEDEARAVAAMFDLPLDVVRVGTGALERELEELIHGEPATGENRSLGVEVAP
jgi:hypothetical protein